MILLNLLVNFLLISKGRSTFLLVCSALCWTIWKYRNEFCFQLIAPKSLKQIVLLIISLVKYWTGSKRVRVHVAGEIYRWIPVGDIINVIPLQQYHEDTTDCGLHRKRERNKVAKSNTSDTT